MEKQYFITIKDPEQHEKAIDHLTQLKFFVDYDMRKADDETIVTGSSGAYDGALMYLAYKGIDFINFESP